ncbi:MAG: phosphodiesterase [Rhodospirillales bacterium]|nr:phosphodiesterase [Rhodospirillales bacterium]
MIRLPSILVCLGLSALAGCAHGPSGTMVPTAQNPPMLILVSIDGFRADYLDRGLTPNIASLAANGVRAQAMRPAFPSITFPNHYTLVTGLYPDHHGIVNNTMEDPAIPGLKFSTDNARDERWWDEATPVWVTAQRQGLHAATMLWPASDIPNHGVLPDHFVPTGEKTPPDQRTDKVLGWVELPPGQRPAFTALYFDQVDTAGHLGGPDSEEVNQALRLVDAAIGRLVAGLRQRGLFDRTNLVILADHGMDSTSLERTIYLDDFVPTKDVHVEAIGSMTGLRAEPGHEAAVEQALLGQHAHMQCWRKAELPPRFHYGANPRVPALLCLAEPGWSIWTHAFVASLKGGFVMGMHGYDNADPRMGALFVAEGPAFHQGVVHPAFDNVDVYPLLTHLLRIKPEQNDGQFSVVADMLKAG